MNIIRICVSLSCSWWRWVAVIVAGGERAEAARSPSHAKTLLVTAISFLLWWAQEIQLDRCFYASPGEAAGRTEVAMIKRPWQFYWVQIEMKQSFVLLWCTLKQKVNSLRAGVFYQYCSFDKPAWYTNTQSLLWQVMAINSGNNNNIKSTKTQMYWAALH